MNESEEVIIVESKEKSLEFRKNDVSGFDWGVSYCFRDY